MGMVYRLRPAGLVVPGWHAVGGRAVRRGVARAALDLAAGDPMRVLALCLLSIAGGVALVASALPGGAVDLTHRRYVPGLAADSAPTPTATPTPLPGPGGSGSDLAVAMFIEIDANELSVTDTGTTVVHISAEVQAPLPTDAQPFVTASGTWTIAAHPPDAAGCTWTRTVTKDTFKVTFFHTTDPSIMAEMELPEWYYIQQCPEAPPIRYPYFGEEGLKLFLRDVMEPYLVGTNEVRVPTDAVPGSSCVKQYKKLQKSTFQGDATVEFYVYPPGPGCVLTPPP